jgi:gamma-glutamylcyclotransferase (GGCT)/AIG2-like uncharacterized protein YtfP
MCQSKSQGGKRCAAHTPGYQAVTAWASTVTDLDDAQVKSVLKRVKKEHKDAPTPNATMVRGFPDSLRAQAQADTRLDLNPDERAKVLAAIDAAHAEVDAGVLPDGATLATWETAMVEAEAADEALFQTVLASGRHQRVPTDRMAAMVRQWRRDPDRYDHCESPDPAFRIDAAALGLPTDTATQHALRKLGWENYLAQRLPCFVYGTLREGQGNRGRFGNSIEESVPARVSGVGIYGADFGFPYAKEHEDPDAVTVGDLVTVSADHEGDRARAGLDMLEGFNSNWPENSHYRRVVRDVEVGDGQGGTRSVKAWTYLAAERAAHRLREEDRIVTGDWVAAKRDYRAGRSSRYART